MDKKNESDQSLAAPLPPEPPSPYLKIEPEFAYITFGVFIDQKMREMCTDKEGFNKVKFAGIVRHKLLAMFGADYNAIKEDGMEFYPF